MKEEESLSSGGPGEVCRCVTGTELNMDYKLPRELRDFSGLCSSVLP